PYTQAGTFRCLHGAAHLSPRKGNGTAHLTLLRLFPLSVALTPLSQSRGADESFSVVIVPRRRERLADRSRLEPEILLPFGCSCLLPILTPARGISRDISRDHSAAVIGEHLPIRRCAGWDTLSRPSALAAVIRQFSSTHSRAGSGFASIPK